MGSVSVFRRHDSVGALCNGGGGHEGEHGQG